MVFYEKKVGGGSRSAGALGASAGVGSAVNGGQGPANTIAFGQQTNPYTVDGHLWTLDLGATLFLEATEGPHIQDKAGVLRSARYMLEISLTLEKPMKIATWNINGVKARIDTALAWLEKSQPDIACFQEIKSVDEAFPSAPFENLGYTVALHGQKSFNGVAILSKFPVDEVHRGLPGDESDEQVRYLEAVISTPGGAIRVASIYLPNGNPTDSDKFPYKLAFMDRLKAHAQSLLELEEAVVFAGDYNIIPTADDAYNVEIWEGDALYRPESRSRFHALLNLGLTDSLRACSDEVGLYTFWDYQAGAWQKNNGIRIDHLLLSPQAADRLQSCEIDRFTRGWEKPSDHVPVWIELAE